MYKSWRKLPKWRKLHCCVGAFWNEKYRKRCNRFIDTIYKRKGRDQESNEAENSEDAARELFALSMDGRALAS